MKKILLSLAIAIAVFGGANSDARDRRMPIAAVAGGDAFWANVVLLACNETGKADGNTSWDDQSNSNHTINSASGAPEWDTAQSVNGTMGASCLFDGVDDALNVASHADFNPGTGDFTIDYYARFVNFTDNPVQVEIRGAEPQVAPAPYVGSDGTFRLWVNGADVITGTTTLSTGTWYHFEWSRVSGTSRLFVNGTQEGSNYSDANNYGQRAVTIGTRFDFCCNKTNGWISNVRITDAGRHSGNFTAPTPPFPQN